MATKLLNYLRNPHVISAAGFCYGFSFCAADSRNSSTGKLDIFEHPFSAMTRGAISGAIGIVGANFCGAIMPIAMHPIIPTILTVATVLQLKKLNNKQ